jgi:enamine deaminase RidA (YjgF/YER057c/UK114 family)
MSERQLFSTGTRFEKIFGYSRAVRVGPWISVAGCTASGPDGPVGGDDIIAQTAECLRRVRDGVEQAGGSAGDVVRTRFFVTDISRLEEIGAVHVEFFGDVLPVSTIVEVTALAHPALLVEVEADAVVAAEVSG